MKARLITTTTWFAAEPWRVRAIATGLTVALALVAGLLPQEVALAGPAVGGSRNP